LLLRILSDIASHLETLAIVSQEDSRTYSKRE
jgi:hypothetical protein